jgi:hypothetical protein
VTSLMHATRTPARSDNTTGRRAKKRSHSTIGQFLM